MVDSDHQAHNKTPHCNINTIKINSRQDGKAGKRICDREHAETPLPPETPPTRGLEERRAPLQRDRHGAGRGKRNLADGKGNPG